MAIKYYKLFDMMNRRGMKKTDLYKILSSKTVAKLTKGEYVSGEVIEKICKFMQCQPGDIMEYITIGKESGEFIWGKEEEHEVEMTIYTDDEQITDIVTYDISNEEIKTKGYKKSRDKKIQRKCQEYITAENEKKL